MATKKTPRSTSASRSRATTKRRTTTRRRTTSSALQPRRRASRPGLPTTLGTALGALVVTTLLDLSWPVRIGLIVLVLVVGLAYVMWKHRAEIAAGAAATAGDETDGQPSAEPAPPVVDAAGTTGPVGTTGSADTESTAAPVTDPPPAPPSGR